MVFRGKIRGFRISSFRAQPRNLTFRWKTASAKRPPNDALRRRFCMAIHASINAVQERSLHFGRDDDTGAAYPISQHFVIRPTPSFRATARNLTCRQRNGKCKTTARRCSKASLLHSRTGADNRSARKIPPLRSG